MLAFNKIKGMLYIVAAASGTGKTTLIDALIKRTKNLNISISHTTRPIRSNEKSNKSYFFISTKQFKELIEKEAFLEYARVFGYYYGTSRKIVEKSLDAGCDVVLDIDWQGARQIRKKMECTTIFLLPPSYSELRSRLERRGREDYKLIEGRLLAASSEISHFKEFDYIVINDDFADALSDLQAIIRCRRLKLEQQFVRYGSLIKELV